MFCLLLIFLLSAKGFEIFVLKNNDSYLATAGKNSFTNLSQAFSSLPNFTDQINRDKKLDIVLEPNSADHPHVISESNIDSHYFSPFSFLSGSLSVRICGGICENDNETAYISLRTEKLILEIKYQLTLKNLKIDGKDLPVAQSQSPCLLTEKGCCNSEKDYLNSNHICYLFRKKTDIQVVDPFSPYKYFSFITDQCDQCSTPAILNLLDIVIEQMNPTSRYGALITLRNRATSLRIENVMMNINYFSKAPLIIGEMTGGDSTMDFANLVLNDYNKYLIDDERIKEYSFCLAEFQANWTSPKLTATGVNILGNLIAITNSSNITIEYLQVYNSAFALIFLYGTKGATIKNSTVENAFGNKYSVFTLHYFSVEECDNVLFEGNKLINLDFRVFASTINSINSKSLILKNNIFLNIITNKAAILEANYVDYIIITENIVNKGDSMQHGMFFVSGTIKEFICSDIIFSQINGSNGAILSSVFDAKIFTLLFKNCNFSEINGANSYIFGFIGNIPLNMTFEKTEFKNVRGKNLIFLHKSIMTNDILFFTINNSLMLDLSLQILYIDYQNSFILINNTKINRSSSEKDILFLKSRGSKSIIIDKTSIKNSLSQDSMLSFVWVEMFFLSNSIISNIKGNGKINALDSFIGINNLTFSQIESTTGIYFLFQVNCKSVITQSTFSDVSINFYSGFSLIADSVNPFNFIDCIFKNLNFINVGCLIINSGQFGLNIMKCQFIHLSGSAVIIFGGLQNTNINVNESYFFDIQIRDKGSVAILGQNSSSKFNNCKFNQIKSKFNGPIAVLQQLSKIEVYTCFFNNITGTKGGLFFNFDNTVTSLHSSVFVNCFTIGDGGIIAISSFSKIEVLNSTFVSISSSGSGGIFYCAATDRLKIKSIYLVSSHFVNCSANQDGGVGYFDNINDISIYNIVVKSCFALNAGFILVKLSSNVIINNINASDTKVIEKGGVGYFESCSSIIFTNGNFFNISNVNKGNFFYIINSVINFSDLLLSSSKTNSFQSLIFIYNNMLTEIYFRNTKVIKCEGKYSLFMIRNDNNLPEDLYVYLRDFLFEENFFLLLFESYNNVINITNLSLKNNNCKDWVKSVGFDIQKGYLLLDKIFVQNTELKIFVSSNITGFITLKQSNFTFANRIESLISISKTPSIIIETVRFLFSNKTDTKLLIVDLVHNFEISGLEMDFPLLEDLNLKNLQLIFTQLSNINIRNVSINNLQSSADNLMIFDLKNNSFLCNNLKIVVCSLISTKIVVRYFSSYDKMLIENIFVSVGPGKKIQGSLIFEIFPKAVGIGNDSSLTINIKNIIVQYARAFYKFYNILGTIILDSSQFFESQGTNESFSSFYFFNCKRASLKNISANKLYGMSALEFAYFKKDLLDTGDLFISSSNFQGISTSEYGGAIAVKGSVNISIRDSIFKNNKAEKKGGAIYIRNPFNASVKIEIKNNTFEGNKASFGSQVISMLTENRAILSKFYTLFDENIFLQNGNQPSNSSLDVSSGIVNNNFMISIIIEGKLNLTINSSDIYSPQRTPFEPFSGEEIQLGLQFFDYFWQPVTDMDGSTMICKSEYDFRRMFSYMYLNNIAKIKTNRGDFNKFKIVSPVSGEETFFTCRISFETLMTEDMLTSSYQTIPIPFKIAPCKIGQILRENSCITCVGSYSFEKNITVASKCYPCPLNAKCINGSSIVPKEGYWSYDRYSLKIIKCTIPSACLGSLINPCSNSYRGNLCNDCEEGFGKSINHECLACSNNFEIFLITAKFMILTAILVFITYYFCLSNYNPNQLALIFLIRNFIDFLEISAILFSFDIGDVGFFSHYKRLLQVFSFYKGFDFLIDCLTIEKANESKRFLNRYFITFSIPFFYSIFIWLTFVTYKYVRLNKSPFKESAKLAKKVFSLCLLSFLTTIISESCSIFMCKSLHSSRIGFKTFLSSHLSLECYDNNHINFLIPICMTFLSAYVLITLSLMILSLITNNEAKFNYYFDSFKVFGNSDKKLILNILVYKIFILIHVLDSKFNQINFEIAFGASLIFLFIVIYFIPKDILRNRLGISFLLNIIVIYVSSQFLKSSLTSASNQISQIIPTILLFLTVFYNVVLLIREAIKLKKDDSK